MRQQLSRKNEQEAQSQYDIFPQRGVETKKCFIEYTTNDFQKETHF